MKRRQFIRNASGLAAFPFLSAEGASGADPYRVIYSNDTTNILSCLRPENRNVAFTDDMLRKSITEAAGVDAHFLQPGLGWIPWWKSKIYSVEEHYAWLQDKFGVKGVRKMDRYMMKGGDMLKTLVETCGELGIAPFLSFRLNDGHHVRELAEALKHKRPTPNMARHYWENYEQFRIGSDTRNWDDGVFDWSIAEVRDFKFALIEEACANYDIAGLELDFLRHWVRFGEKTGSDERFDITTNFVRRVRKMLDKTAADRGLPRRSLCVRVPANAQVRPDQGVDLKSLVDAGVDMINLSYSYFTWQDNGVREARAEVGEDPSVYCEMTHTTMTGKATAGSGTQPYLRTTDEQFYTTTRLAFEQGATGVSLFNFPYYRYHVTDTIGPFHEPPFSIIPRLKDREFLARQKESYFLSMGRKDRVLGERIFPAILKRSHPQTFEIGMLPGKVERKNGLLRLRSDEAIADREIEVKFSGVALKPEEPVVAPIPHPYTDTWMAKPEELACFSLAAEVPLKETNQIEILVKKGIRVRLIYLDLTFSG
ncbi:MAG: hypothetical protein P1V20_01210 [Verrucomicrobiales bacterium]|nr:hypothetical protein [Verrucomicrobiales bacterium]